MHFHEKVNNTEFDHECFNLSSSALWFEEKELIQPFIILEGVGKNVKIRIKKKKRKLPNTHYLHDDDYSDDDNENHQYYPMDFSLNRGKKYKITLKTLNPRIMDIKRMKIRKKNSKIPKFPHNALVKVYNKSNQFEHRFNYDIESCKKEFEILQYIQTRKLYSENFYHSNSLIFPISWAVGNVLDDEIYPAIVQSNIMKTKLSQWMSWTDICFKSISNCYINSFSHVWEMTKSIFHTLIFQLAFLHDINVCLLNINANTVNGHFQRESYLLCGFSQFQRAQIISKNKRIQNSEEFWGIEYTRCGDDGSNHVIFKDHLSRIDSPEKRMFMKKNHYQHFVDLEKYDVWCLGVLLFELIFRQKPFRTIRLTENKKTTFFDYDKPVFPLTSDDDDDKVNNMTKEQRQIRKRIYYWLHQHLLQMDPYKRSSMKEIYQMSLELFENHLSFPVEKSIETLLNQNEIDNICNPS